MHPANRPDQKENDMTERETIIIPPGDIPAGASDLSAVLLKIMQFSNSHVRLAALMQVLGVTLCEVSPSLEGAKENLKSLELSVLAHLPEAFAVVKAMQDAAMMEEALAKPTHDGSIQKGI